MFKEILSLFYNVLVLNFFNMSHCILDSGYCFGLWRKGGIENKSHLQNFFLLKLVTLAITDLKVSPIHVVFHRLWTPSQQRRTLPLYFLCPSTFSPTLWGLMKLRPNSKCMILFFNTDCKAQFVTNIHGWGNTRCTRTNAMQSSLERILKVIY
jgi:hypothetical protein